MGWDQIGRFDLSNYIPLPWSMAFHAAAREADQTDGPVMIGCGGARGPGKSHTIMAQVGLDDCQRFNGLKWLFLRRVQKSAAESFDDLVRKVLGSVPCEVTAGRVMFPNDSRVLIGGYNNERDIDKYLGIEYDGIVLEEGTQITGDKRDKIRGSLRTGRSDWRPRWYESTNPGGIGHGDFKNLYVIPYRKHQETTTRFFPSTYRDNPFLNKEYVDYLLGLKGALGQAWRDGDWDIFEGMAFSSFRWERHTCKPFEIPAHWSKWRAVDWGFRNPFACVWIAKDPDTGRLYVYRELYQAGLTDRQQARAIKDNTPPGEKISITFADPSMWAKKNVNDLIRSSAEEYAAEGVILTKANNERLPRKRKLDTLLADLPDGRPGIIFFENCADCLRTIPELPYSTRNIEDVDSEAEDHCFVAGTRVITRDGWKPIESIQKGDEVLTRFGWFPVERSWMTNDNAKVITAILSDGTEITGTPNHPVFVSGKGWTRLDSLRYGDIMSTWKSAQYLSRSTEQFIEDFRIALTGLIGGITARLSQSGKRERTICTETFGDTITAKSRQDTRYTISTEILSITLLKISNVFRLINTETGTVLLKNVLNGYGNTLTRSDLKPPSGTSLMKESSGISSTVRKLRRIDQWLKRLASSAGKHISLETPSQDALGSVPIDALLSGVGTQALITLIEFAQSVILHSKSIATKMLPAARVSVVQSYAAGNAPVYNLHISGHHEYYAEGVLVHNCYDALTYGLTAINTKPQMPRQVITVTDPLAQRVNLNTGGVLTKDF